jgi:hypothetical protein
MKHTQELPKQLTKRKENPTTLKNPSHQEIGQIVI